MKAFAQVLVVSINERTLCLQKKRKADGEGGKQAQGKRKRAPGEKKPWWEEDNGGRHERDDDAAYYREEVRTVSFSPALPVIIYRMTSADVCHALEPCSVAVRCLMIALTARSPVTDCSAHHDIIDLHPTLLILFKNDSVVWIPLFS